jgi:ADP-dependent NAD(P)H-hydrate dehydratase / NAD(P)H-hydrate epimerase
MADRAPALSLTRDDASKVPWPNSYTHKHSRGRLAVVAGGPLYTGAARLAARAGQRIGAGWVSLFGTREACTIMAQHETSILICERVPGTSLSNQIEGFEAVVIGPALGLNDAALGDAHDVMGGFRGALLLDADALSHISASRETFFGALKSRASPAILTPHSGEFTKLFGRFDADAKVAATRTAAHQSGCVIVHKGAISVIADPDGQVFTSDIGSPFLASAGTGDVLAGMIGGLLAQNMSPLEAAKAAVWIHGQASGLVGAGLIAEDLILALPDCLNGLAPEGLKRV